MYRFLRSLGLPAQLAIDCRDKAFETYASHMGLKRTGRVWRRFPHLDGAPAIRFNIPRPCRLFTRRRDRFRDVRRAVERARGSRGAARIIRREQDFVRTSVHTVTRRFAQRMGQFPLPLVALEDLRHIRAKFRESKKLNRRIHSWPFRSGQDMLVHKGCGMGRPSSVSRGRSRPATAAGAGAATPDVRGLCLGVLAADMD